MKKKQPIVFILTCTDHISKKQINTSITRVFFAYVHCCGDSFLWKEDGSLSSGLRNHEILSNNHEERSRPKYLMGSQPSCSLKQEIKFLKADINSYYLKILSPPSTEDRLFIGRSSIELIRFLPTNYDHRCIPHKKV